VMMEVVILVGVRIGCSGAGSPRLSRKRGL